MISELIIVSSFFSSSLKCRESMGKIVWHCAFSVTSFAFVTNLHCSFHMQDS